MRLEAILVLILYFFTGLIAAFIYRHKRGKMPLFDWLGIVLCGPFPLFIIFIHFISELEIWDKEF